MFPRAHIECLRSQQPAFGIRLGTVPHGERAIDLDGARPVLRLLLGHLKPRPATLAGQLVGDGPIPEADGSHVDMMTAARPHGTSNFVCYSDELTHAEKPHAPVRDGVRPVLTAGSIAGCGGGGPDAGELACEELPRRAGG